jgi:hypothetical protein
MQIKPQVDVRQHCNRGASYRFDVKLLHIFENAILIAKYPHLRFITIANVTSFLVRRRHAGVGTSNSINIRS